MSGTIGSPSTIMSTEIVDNTSGAITPAMIRDTLETAVGVATIAVTTSHTVVVTDRGNVLNYNSASAGNITVNTSVLSAGHSFGVRQVSTGRATIVAGSGMSLASSSGTFATRAQWSLVIVTVHTDGTTLLVDGDTA